MVRTATLALAGLAVAYVGFAVAASILNVGGDISAAGGWNNGKPSSTNPGTITVDGINTDTTFGYGACVIMAKRLRGTSDRDATPKTFRPRNRAQ